MDGKVPYSNTLKSLTYAFSEALKSSRNVVNAMNNVMLAINKLTLGNQYKSALQDACLEAASLVDLDICNNNEDVVNEFRKHLDEQLAPLFSKTTSYTNLP